MMRFIVLFLCFIYSSMLFARSNTPVLVDKDFHTKDSISIYYSNMYILFNAIGLSYKLNQQIELHAEIGKFADDDIGIYTFGASFYSLKKQNTSLQLGLNITTSFLKGEYVLSTFSFVWRFNTKIIEPMIKLGFTYFPIHNERYESNSPGDILPFFGFSFHIPVIKY